MKKTLLLIKTTLFLTLFGASNSFAQYVDVTSQYIPNAGFEECEALPTKVVHDNQKNVDVNVVELYQESSVAKGYDYEAQGWKLVEQQKETNGGVITYGCNVQIGRWTPVGEPGPATGITGNKGLCFVGNKGLVYQQAQEITLPAGVYRLTVNLYARNGQTTNPGPTQQVVNIKTGFMPTGGTEDDLIPAKRGSKQFTSNAWDTEVLDIELTQSTKGRFQISYGTSYFVVVDDVKLEYQGGVVTTALANVVTKAKALNSLLGTNADLTTAIGAAEDFIANPTTQDDVATEVEKLYNAMSTALATATQPLDITSIYVDNPSFETGAFGEWVCNGGSIKNINEEAPITPRCDGVKIVEFAGMSDITQNISHMPAGFYLVSAKVSGKANLVLGTTPSSVTGGTYNTNAPLFLRVYTSAASFEAGAIAIGSSGTGTYKIDDFHLYYAKDATSLDALALAAVKADANAIIAESQYNNITGEERSETVTALEGADYTVINEKLNRFVLAKTAYDDFVAAQTKAAPYTAANYPYADKTLLETVKTICGTTAQSSTLAKEMTTQLNAAIAAIPFSNAYCEGIADKVDHTSKIVAANAAGATGTAPDPAWSVNNISIIKVSSYKARPTKEGTTDRETYGTPDSYNSGTSSMQQIISNLPAGKYVVAVSMMASNNLEVTLRANNKKVATFIGTGTASTSGWKEVVSDFDLEQTGDVTLRLEEGADSGTKLWYCDNFRLYCIENGGETGILSVTNNKTTDNSIFDLSGRRVNQPTKGLYIVNGKKVIIK